jgi:hypothetical protein
MDRQARNRDKALKSKDDIPLLLGEVESSFKLVWTESMPPHFKLTIGHSLKGAAAHWTDH